MSVEERRLGSNPSLMTLDRQMLRGYLNLPAPVRHVPILSGFSSKAVEQDQVDPFVSESAFDLASAANQKLQYSSTNASTGSWFRNETSRKSRSSEHLSVHLAVSVDLGLVGGGVSGTYDKNVVKNSDVSHKKTETSRLCRHRIRSTCVLNSLPPRLSQYPGAAAYDVAMSVLRHPRRPCPGTRSSFSRARGWRLSKAGSGTSTSAALQSAGILGFA